MKHLSLFKHQPVFFKTALVIALTIISYLSVIKIEQPLPGHLSDKFYHGLAFYALAFLSDYAFPKTGFNAQKYIPLSAYGFFIEVIQFFLPYRSFSLADMIADVAGLAIYAITLPVLLILWPKTENNKTGNA